MKQLNRYYRHAKISERKTGQIIKYFALDLTAHKTALLTDLTRKSVNQIYLKIRNRVAEETMRASPFASCQIEVDESYFGARRVRGKRGRGAGGKTIVFGIYKRERLGLDGNCSERGSTDAAKHYSRQGIARFGDSLGWLARLQWIG